MGRLSTSQLESFGENDIIYKKKEKK